MFLATLYAGIAWFVGAGVFFFNPVVDKAYRTEDDHPSVRVLPQNPKTILMILAAVFVQTFLWAFVYEWVKGALPEDPMSRGLMFGGIICLVKIIPRDVDRILLTTYPMKRMTIEFIAGILMAFVVGFVFSYTL